MNSMIRQSHIREIDLHDFLRNYDSANTTAVSSWAKSASAELEPGSLVFILEPVTLPFGLISFVKKEEEENFRITDFAIIVRKEDNRSMAVSLTNNTYELRFLEALLEERARKAIIDRKRFSFVAAKPSTALSTQQFQAIERLSNVYVKGGTRRNFMQSTPQEEPVVALLSAFGVHLNFTSVNKQPIDIGSICYSLFNTDTKQPDSNRTTLKEHFVRVPGDTADVKTPAELDETQGKHIDLLFEKSTGINPENVQDAAGFNLLQSWGALADNKGLKVDENLFAQASKEMPFDKAPKLEKIPGRPPVNEPNAAVENFANTNNQIPPELKSPAPPVAKKVEEEPKDQPYTVIDAQSGAGSNPNEDVYQHLSQAITDLLAPQPQAQKQPQPETIDKKPPSVPNNASASGTFQAASIKEGNKKKFPAARSFDRLPAFEAPVSIKSGADKDKITQDQPIVEKADINPQSPAVEKAGNNLQSPIVEKAGNNLQSSIVEKAGNNLQSPIVEKAGNNPQLPIVEKADINPQPPVIEKADNIPHAAIPSEPPKAVEPTVSAEAPIVSETVLNSEPSRKPQPATISQSSLESVSDSNKVKDMNLNTDTAPEVDLAIPIVESGEFEIETGEGAAIFASAEMMPSKLDDFQEPKVVMNEMASLMSKLESQVARAAKKLAARASEIEKRLTTNLDALLNLISQEDKDGYAELVVSIDQLSKQFEELFDTLKSELAEKAASSRALVKDKLVDYQEKIDSSKAEHRDSLVEDFKQSKSQFSKLLKDQENELKKLITLQTELLDKRMANVDLILEDFSISLGEQLDGHYKNYQDRVDEKATSLLKAFDHQLDTLNQDSERLHLEGNAQLGQAKKEFFGKLDRLIKVTEIALSRQARKSQTESFLPKLKERKQIIEAMLNEMAQTFAEHSFSQAKAQSEGAEHSLVLARQQLKELVEERLAKLDVVGRNQQSGLEEIFKSAADPLEHNTATVMQLLQQAEQEINECEAVCTKLAQSYNLDGDPKLTSLRQEVYGKVDALKAELKGNLETILDEDCLKLEESTKNHHIRLNTKRAELVQQVRSASDKGLQSIRQAIHDAFHVVQSEREKFME